MTMTTSGLRLVRFGTEKAEFAGFSELMKAGQSVRLVKKRDYLITSKQCQLLSDRGIKYDIVKKL